MRVQIKWPSVCYTLPPHAEAFFSNVAKVVMSNDSYFANVICFAICYGEIFVIWVSSKTFYTFNTNVIQTTQNKAQN